MLNQSYLQWSEETLRVLKNKKCESYSKNFLQQLSQFDITQPVNEKELKMNIDYLRITMHR